MNFSIRNTLFSWFGFWIVIAIISLLLIWNKGLRFGIDLVGGTYIMLQVQTDKAVEAELKNRIVSSQSLFEKENIYATSSELEKNSILFSFEDNATAQKAAEQLKKKWSDIAIATENKTVRVELNQHAVTVIQDEAVNRNIEVLRTRLDQISVAEISIAKHGQNSIVIELPDVKDPQEAKAMIGKPAMLEFRLVHQADKFPMIRKSAEDIIFDMGGEIPSNLEILPGKEEGPRQEKVYYLVSKFSELTGAALRDAQPMQDQLGQPVLSFTFTSEGGSIFSELTDKNIGKLLAIVLDGVVISAPRIKTKIPDGKGIIEGNKDVAEVKELALLLRSGAFVAPVTFEEERQIGPTLGAEAIRQGITACLVGLALLFIFSIFYYKFSGFLAFLALVFNLFFVVFGLSQLGATLTLPGIAGIVLTLGMAIDASILIFERIKEELASGKSTRNAVEAGFSDAMTVILDANITTFIVGVVLYRFGTGPIQGFAVTMMLGIIATLLTGLFFLKSLFAFILDNFTIQKLRI